MSPSIPLSELIDTEPSVLGAGGNPLSLNAVFLTNDPSIPIGVAQPFPNAAAVSSWFGAMAPENVDFGQPYFKGFTGADALPSTLYFFQYNESAVGGYLRGGNLAALTLTELKALSGTIIVTVDGVVVTTANINLNSATSPANAATLIQTALQAAGAVFSGTATTTNGSPILTINSTVSGELHVGDVVVGTDIPANTHIASFGTYTVLSGVGTVNLSANATAAVGPEAVTVSSLATCTYDSLRQAFVIGSATTGVNSSVGFASGTLAAPIALTQATGAVLSAGAAAADPADAMNAVVASTQNWATFTTVFEADVPTALGFAAWVSGATPAGVDRFLYVEWDSNLAETTGADPTSFGAMAVAAAYDGVMPNFDLSQGQKAAFICGLIASIDFDAFNGNTSLAYRGQAGLTPDVTSATVAENLAGKPYGSGGNGYNFYAAFGSANQQFQNLQPGSMVGQWKWVQPYINQIAMNADFQLALMELETNVKNIPFNQNGRNLIRGALQDPIDKYVNFGAIQSGVTLSAAQIQEVNLAAGMEIDGTLFAVGYFLQILDPSPQIRAARGPFPLKFWWTDGGSVQSFTLATIDVQ